MLGSAAVRRGSGSVAADWWSRGRGPGGITCRCTRAPLQNSLRQRDSSRASGEAVPGGAAPPQLPWRTPCLRCLRLAIPGRPLDACSVRGPIERLSRGSGMDAGGSTWHSTASACRVPVHCSGCASRSAATASPPPLVGLQRLAWACVAVSRPCPESVRVRRCTVAELHLQRNRCLHRMTGTLRFFWVPLRIPSSGHHCFESWPPPHLSVMRFVSVGVVCSPHTFAIVQRLGSLKAYPDKSMASASRLRPNTCIAPP